MFQITMLPANEGDSLLLEYGETGFDHRILIDVGRKKTFDRLLEAVPKPKRHFELLVISHVDRDHIEGALTLLKDEINGFSFDDIWFNGFRHLDWHGEVEDFGGKQGDKLTTTIVARGLPWNKAFGGGPVRIEHGPLVKTLPGGMKLTLLSPDRAKLEALLPVWEDECLAAGIDPSLEDATRIAEWRAEEAEAEKDDIEFFGSDLEELADTFSKDDTKPANGSSIAFIAEYDGKKLLCAADAHPTILAQSLAQVGKGTPVDLAAMKVSHHGSKGNTNKALLAAIDCRTFLVSTNGHYFDHPNGPAIARLLVKEPGASKHLYFNYDQEHTRVWNESQSQRQKYNYICHFPGEGGKPVPIRLDSLSDDDTPAPSL